MVEEKLIVCKACGFKIEEKKLRSVCPACGVSSKFFEEYKDKISGKRRRLLDLYFHPRIVHFPIVAAVLLFLVLVIVPFSSGRFRQILEGGSIVLSTLLPLFILAGIVSGLFDGKLRFKKINRPILVKKIYISISSLIVSAILVFLVFTFGFSMVAVDISLILLSLLAAAFNILLGSMGGKLIEAILPGK